VEPEPPPEPVPEPPPEVQVEVTPEAPEVEIEPELPAQQTAEASSIVQLDDAPAFRYNPDPRYPPASLRRNEQGVVSLQVETDADGRVTDARIVTSSGYPLLDRSAVIAIRRWHCEPTEVNGRRVAASFIIDITFSLDQQK
jgi:protein TonB